MAHAGRGEGIAGTPPLLFTDASAFDRVDDAGTVILFTGSIYGYPGGTNGVTSTGDNPLGAAAHGAMPGNSGLEVVVPASNHPVTNSGYHCLLQTDLAVIKSANPTSLSIGQTTTFALTISNSGPAQATAATVIDGLPTGLGTLTFVGHQSRQHTIVGTRPDHHLYADVCEYSAQCGYQRPS